MRQLVSCLLVAVTAFDLACFVCPVLQEMSRLLNTGLDSETLATCVRLLESGINPEALASIIRELRREAAALRVSVLLR